MMNNPEILRELLERLTDALIVYVCHQIDSGAQVGCLGLAPLRSAPFCSPSVSQMPACDAHNTWSG